MSDTDLPPVEIRRELLKSQRAQVLNTAFVHRSQAKAFADAGLTEEARKAAEEQAKWERVLTGYDTQLKELSQ